MGFEVLVQVAEENRAAELEEERLQREREASTRDGSGLREDLPVDLWRALPDATA